MNLLIQPIKINFKKIFILARDQCTPYCYWALQNKQQVNGLKLKTSQIGVSESNRPLKTNTNLYKKRFEKVSGTVPIFRSNMRKPGQNRHFAGRCSDWPIFQACPIFFAQFSSKLDAENHLAGFLTFFCIRLNGLEIFKFKRAAQKNPPMLNLLFILRHTVSIFNF